MNFREIKLQKTPMTENPFYLKSFNLELSSIWQNTEFKRNIENLAYKRTLMAFLRGSHVGEWQRRRILFTYLSYILKQDNDKLNKFYNILPSNRLFVKRAIENLNVVYNDIPNREIKGKNDKQLKELLKTSNYDLMLRKVSDIAKLSNECLIRICFKHETLHYKIYSPDKYCIKYDALDNIQEIWIPFYEMNEDNYSLSGFTQKVKYYKWTLEKLIVLDSEMNQIPFVSNGIMVNEISNNFRDDKGNLYLPFILCQNEKESDDDLEIAGGDLFSLVYTQIECNVLDYITQQSYFYNSFPLLELINYRNSKDDEIELGFDTVMMFDDVRDIDGRPVPPSGSYITPTPQYAELQMLKETKQKECLRSLGLPTTMLSDNPGIASGVALMVDRMELAEQRKKDVEIYQKLEVELINLTAIVSNNDIASSNFKFSSNNDYEIKIDFVEQSIFQEKKDEFEYLNNSKNEGVIAPVEYVKRLAQDDTIITNEQAIEFIKKNKNYYKQITEVLNDTTFNPGIGTPTVGELQQATSNDRIPNENI